MSDVFLTSLQSIELYNFRNHTKLKFLELGPEPVVITGKNGIGKTNILEAISLLTATKGLRSAKIAELNNQKNPNNVWKIISQIRSKYGLKEIITHLKQGNLKKESRAVQIDGQLIKKKSELNEIIKVVWLTPPMQQLFINSSSERRSFFDQIVTNFFPEHVSVLSKYEQAMRERLKLLKTQQNDDYWLSALEQNMFEAAGIITDYRMKTLEYLRTAIKKNNTQFSKAAISLINEPISGGYLEKLKKNRGLDAASGRTNLGSHLFDLNVIFEEKNMLAKFCSTGEQKALLLNLLLAQVHAIIDIFKVTPILLLDEIISHLDDVNRKLLFDEIVAVKAQAWLTGIDPKSFAYIKDLAKFIHLE